MEFKNRQATNPGRVTLKNVSTGATTTYDLTMADERSKARRLTRQQWTLSKRIFSMKYSQNWTERLCRVAQLWRLSSSTPTVCLCVCRSQKLLRTFNAH